MRLTHNVVALICAFAMLGLMHAVMYLACAIQMPGYGLLIHPDVLSLFALTFAVVYVGSKAYLNRTYEDRWDWDEDE